MSTPDFISNQIREIVGDDGLAKARIVSSRAALLKDFDPDIDMSSLIVGLYVGNDGDMPESLPLGVLGLINALALLQADSIMENVDHPEH